MPYSPDFLKGVKIDIPAINKKTHPNIVTHKNKKTKKVLEYEHHSVILNKDRRLAIISACNIDGNLIPDGPIKRRGNFKNNSEIGDLDQLGTSFYKKCGKLIDKGHLTKFEDVIWGKGLTTTEFEALGRTTNFYPNAAPQHRRLNRGKWKSLELYILDTETEEKELKICMFTGPVLNENDPAFVHEVDGNSFQMPILFWKIVMYNKNNKLYALGFMMSHQKLLAKANLIREIITKGPEEKKEGLYFTDWKYSKPFQVRVEQIEETAGIKLKASKPIIKPYKDDRPQKIIWRDINLKGPKLPGERRCFTNTRFTNLVTE